MPPYTTDVVLTDGGVYDNLGLETAWKRYRTILVSDGGGHMARRSRSRIATGPRHALRINAIIDNQVRNLRKRQVDRRLSSPVSGTAPTGGSAATPATTARWPAACPVPTTRPRGWRDTPRGCSAMDDGRSRSG